MDNVPSRRKSFRRWSVFVCCLLTVVFLSEGCQPLRKKFTRKKKETKKEFVPVLTPIDYPRASESAPDRYKYHYSLRTVWYKNLMQALEENQSDKRMTYFLEQMLVQLEEMNKWIKGDQHEALGQLIEDGRLIQKEFEEPPLMRRMENIKSKLGATDKKIRNTFNPKAVEGSLVN